MRTIEQKIYSFNELSEDAKQKAIENNHEVNVHEDWYEYIYEDFIESNKDFDIENIYFSGFWSQGDGAMFEYSGISDNLKDEFIDSLGLSPMRAEWLRNNVYVSGKGIQSGHYYHEKSCSHSIYWEVDNGDLHWSSLFYEWLESFTEDFESFVISRYEDLAGDLYSKLSHSYDYLTSEVAIIESIEAIDLEFYEDGSAY
jgi:hypothetical protein